MKQALSDYYQQFMENIYSPNDASSAFVAERALSPEAQLSIYRGSVVGGLIDALGDLFPGVKNGVGEKFFDAMAAKYVRTHPSKSYSLDHYGIEFPEFISQFPPLKDYPYLFDLARLEWAWHKCFHAADTQPFDASVLAQVSIEDQTRICFELADSLTLISSDYPIFHIWAINHPEIEGNDKIETIDLDQGPEHAVVWRDGLITRVSQVSDLEAELILLLQNCDSLGTIFTKLLSNSSHDEDEVNAALVGVVGRSWVVAYQLEDSHPIG